MLGSNSATFTPKHLPQTEGAATMQAALYSDYGKTSDVLTIATVKKPIVGPKDVLVKIKSAGVNPVDWKLMMGYIKSWPNKGPFIPGWDLAGVVEAVGEEVKDFNPADEVYSYHRPEFDKDKTDVISDNGCIAEYASVPQHRLALKPKKASFDEAAAIPLAALTAYQGLHEHLKITKGSTVLVTGGSGGVGSFGVQFAKLAGCTVLSTCSAKNNEFVKSLGADHLIDYTKGSTEQVLKLFPKGVDFLYDAIGGDEEIKKALKEGGGFSGTQSMLVHPDSAQLKTLADHFDAGELSVKVTSFDGLKSSVEALDASAAGRTVGKLVITVAK
jgi:NADPH:quinone reductase-like Zn-dependent oxidoreductase